MLPEIFIEYGGSFKENADDFLLVGFNPEGGKLYGEELATWLLSIIDAHLLSLHNYLNQDRRDITNGPSRSKNRHKKNK